MGFLQLVVALARHAGKRLCPARPRTDAGRTDENRAILHIEVDFVRQPALLDEWLRDAHPTRVADRNQKRFHADNVSTL